MTNIILLFFCLYLPLQIAINPMAGVDLASGRIFIILLFIIWLLEGLKNKKIFIAFGAQTLLIISFLFFNSLSLVVSQNTDWSLRKLAFLFSIFPIYFIVAGSVKNKTALKKIINYLSLGAGIVVIIGIVQFAIQFVFGLDKSLKIWSLVIPPFLGSSFSQSVLENPSWLVNVSGHTIFRATSLFPDPHMFAFYLGMMFPWMLASYFFSDQRRNLYLILSIFSLLTIFLTFSRGGYLGLSAGFILTVIFFWKKIDIKNKKILFVFVLAILLIVFLPGPFGERFLSSFNPTEGSNMGRIETWGKSINIIGNNPLLGVGLGNYSLEIKPSANYREPIYSHSLYLDIASETGIINALIWIALILFSIFSYLKKAKKDAFYLGGAVSLLIFSIHSIFETPLFSVSILPLLLIIIALSTIKDE